MNIFYIRAHAQCIRYLVLVNCR